MEDTIIRLIKITINLVFFVVGFALVTLGGICVFDHVDELRIRLIIFFIITTGLILCYWSGRIIWRQIQQLTKHQNKDL
jgi:hypothetical protein